ncbi:MAG: carboxypeptidase-like regulatory domain-containing protein [Pyrinomonadaceae bacterium]
METEDMFKLGKWAMWFAAILFTINLLASNVSAQDCESYDLYGAVTDDAGKMLPGALVEILDATTKELAKPDTGEKKVPRVVTGKDGRYALFILDLPNIQNGQDFILRISRSGFISHEERINIFYCGFKRDAKLVRAKPSGNSKIKTKRSIKKRVSPKGARR